MRIVLTGSPATGKTSVALALSKLLDCPYVGANEIAFEIGAARKVQSGPSAKDEFTVDLSKLKKALTAIFNKQKTVVAEGHLLCEFALPADEVVVLRADPRLLLRRYAKRKYARKKAVANTLVEVLDYCLIESEENYGRKARIIQLDVTKKTGAAEILAKIKAGRSDHVDWSELLLKPPLSKLAQRA